MIVVLRNPGAIDQQIMTRSQGTAVGSPPNEKRADWKPPVLDFDWQAERPPYNSG
jgi:hypothetical protein